MPYSTARTVLAADIAYRLNDPRSAVPSTIRWDSTAIDNAIDQAILLMQPLGDEVVITMTAAGYVAVPQSPASSLINIKEVRTDNGVSHWTTLPPETYRLQRSQSSWLHLDNDPGPTERIRIYAIREYDRDGAYITADLECVTNYALAVLYERVSTFSQTGSRQDDVTKALDYRTMADVRKEMLRQMMYPMVAPTPTPRSTSAAGAKRK